MRQCQYYSAKELLQYDIPLEEILRTTGLTKVALDHIKKGATLPDTIILQAEDLTSKCLGCSSTNITPCLSCTLSTDIGKKPVEVIRRPDRNKDNMLNVHLALRISKEAAKK